MSDSFERLRLCFVDVLEAPARENGRLVSDGSWARLRKAVPESDTYAVPYSFPLGGAPDDAGIRGECWVSVPSSRDRRRRVLALAEELRGKEVAVTVRPKRYSFVSRAAHNRGEEVTGTSLQLCTIEAL